MEPKWHPVEVNVVTCGEWMTSDERMTCDEWMICDEWMTRDEWVAYDEWMTCDDLMSEHLWAKPPPAVSANPVAGAGPCRMDWHRKPAVFSWSLSQRLQLQRGSLVTDFDESGRILANIGDRCA